MAHTGTLPSSSLPSSVCCFCASLVTAAQGLLVRGGGGSSLYQRGSGKVKVWERDASPRHRAISKAALTSGVQAADWKGAAPPTVEDMAGLFKRWQPLTGPLPSGALGPWSISSIDLFLELETPSGPIVRRMHRCGAVDPTPHPGALPSGAQSIRPGWTADYFDELKLDGPGLLELLEAKCLEDAPFGPISRADLAADCRLFVFKPPEADCPDQTQYVELFSNNTWLAWVAPPKPPLVVLEAHVPMTYEAFEAGLPKDPKDAKQYLRDEWNKWREETKKAARK